MISTKANKPNSLAITSVGGVLLVLAGLLVPSDTMVSYLRASPGDVLDELLQGALLFKLALVVSGLFVFIVGRLNLWKQSGSFEELHHELGGRKMTALLVMILLLASALRLYRLDSGPWLDEILTYSEYGGVPIGEIVTSYDSENQHFLYSILANASLQVFGDEVWALRLPAVLFGVASIWILYLLGCEVSSTKEAFFASALLAFSYHHVWFSQNARGYTGLLFWTLLASWLFIRALRSYRPQYWLLYGLAAALGAYTHLTMLFVILGHFVMSLAALATRRKERPAQRWTGPLLGFITAGIMMFLLFSLVLPQILGVIGGSEASVVEGWKNPIWTLIEIIEGLQLGFSGGLFAAAAIALFAAGFVSYLRSDPSVVALFVIPTVTGAAVTVAVGHHLWPRFFFFAFGFASLIAVRGISVMSGLIGRLAKLTAERTAHLELAANAGMVMLSAASVAFAFGPKQDYGGALAFVNSQKQADDAIVAVGLAANVYQTYYSLDWETADTSAQLDAIRSHAGRTWVIYTFAPVLRSVHPEIMATLDNEFQSVAAFHGSVREGTVFVTRFDRNSAKLPTILDRPQL